MPYNSENNSDMPDVTFGSIVWGALLRSAIVMVSMFYIIPKFDLQQYWYYNLFLIWIIGIYPAYLQNKKYNERIEILEESTMCGSCKYFNKNGQLCKLYDLHVSNNHIPCEGESWEAKNEWDEN